MKKLFVWLILSLALQSGIYLYLDRVLLAPTASFSQHPVPDSNQTEPGARYSYDRSYYALLSDEGIKFYSASDHRLCKEIGLKSNERVTYFHWLPNHNLALVGISRKLSQSATVVLKPVNLETDSRPVEPKIAGLGREAKIEDVTYSELVNVIYILVKNDRHAAVYRTDANNTLRSISLGTTSVGRIASLKSEDCLFFDNLDNGRVYMAANNRHRQAISPTDHRYVLIGADQNDRVYIARVSDSKRLMVDQILAGYPQNDEEFQVIKELQYPYPASSVRVTYDGRLQLI